jgi:hypothetical protein
MSRLRLLYQREVANGESTENAPPDGGRDLGEVTHERFLNYQCLAQVLKAGGRGESVCKCVYL